MPIAAASNPTLCGRNVSSPTTTPSGIDAAANTHGDIIPKPIVEINGREASPWTAAYRPICRTSSGEITFSTFAPSQSFQ